MPTVETFILQGYSDLQKERLITSLTAAVVEAIDAPIDSVRVFLTELAPGNFGIGGRTVANIRANGNGADTANGAWPGKQPD
jgi:4-oxalocrotonate tautomerase